MPRKPSSLPVSLPPIGLSREEAAEFVGVGATKFDAMVADGRMPRPKQIDSRRVWSRTALEKAFARLPEVGAEEEQHDKWETAV